MIVYLRVVDYSGPKLDLYGKPNSANFFTWYRATWLYILSGSGMLWYMINRSCKSCWYHKPLVAYAFLAVLSTIFARYPDMAFWGDPDRNEGLLTQLAYMAIPFLFINLVQNERQLKTLLSVLLASATVLSVIGACQFFGHDYFFGSFGHQFLIPDYLKSAMLDMQSPNQHAIFLTFGNGNFTGSYMTMLFTLTLALLIGLNNRSKFFLIPINLMIFINLLGSKSRAGQLGAFIACAILVIFLRKFIREQARLSIFIVAAYLLVAFSMDAFTMGQQQRFFATSVARPVSTSTRLFGNFNDLKFSKDEARVVFDGVAMRIKFNDEKIEFYDQHDQLVPYKLMSKPTGKAADKNTASSSNPAVISSTNTHNDELAAATLKTSENAAEVTTSPLPKSLVMASPEKLKQNAKAAVVKDNHPQYLVLFPDNRLRGFIIFAWPDLNLLQIGRGGVSFFMTWTPTGFKILDQLGRISELPTVESWGFAGKERFASGRGYIWSRSLPMLKDTILIGNGPDTFSAHYPNHDYLGKLRFVSNGIQRIVDKPHNLYLQTAINTGIISLGALLALFAVYLYNSAKLYLNNRSNEFSQSAGLGIALSIVAYLVAAIFNDSVVTVAPTFWSLLGLGIAANRINQQIAVQSETEIS